MAETITAAGEPRTIALSAITVRDGFNPRGRFDQAALDRLAQTIRETGVLQPLLVHPAETEGEFELVDGERRYRAAFQAGLTEIPVLIRPRDPDTGGLIGALTANFHRASHTPVGEARAFARLLEAGLTRKGITERLQVSRELVRDRLEILVLSQELQARVDDGTIPLGAVRTLAGLAKVHPELPACALRRVSAEPAEMWRRRVTWTDVVADPIGAVTTQYGDEQPDLPAGVYDAHADYTLSTFTLSERAEKDLAALTRLNPAYADRESVTTRFDGGAIEQAARLGAAQVSEHQHSALIVGNDVAAQLVADQIKVQLKTERARARTERDHAPVADRDPTPAASTGAEPAEPVAETEEQAKARRRAEREADAEHRASATAFNLELGVAVLKTFAKVKVDARVLQVLTAVDFKDDLDALAGRGARYGFPGWPCETTTPGGKAKTIYLERHEAEAKAHEFLAGATQPADIAGRCLALVVMAVLADETCVAQSNRSMVSLYDYRPSSYRVPGSTERGLPWRTQVVELVEDLALTRIVIPSICQTATGNACKWTIV
jgi:ParB/RepB/Spo0J family partition protein